MKILVFDDRRPIRNFLEDEFESELSKLHFCNNIYAADDFLKNNKNNIKGIILDIMIPTYGLSDEHRKLTKGGVLTGWVWHHCNPEGLQPHPLENIPIIIYTAYLEDYKKYIESNQPSEEEKKFARHVELLSKDDDDDDEAIIKIRDYFSI